jgi:transcriptional regulator of met regulon
MQITKVQQQCVMILQKAAGQPIVMEKDLRKDLGNTPDTSKALRL